MIGSRLAHYEIIGHIGSGGMGEVYQATDSKLGRSVAIKLLPEGLCHDPERKARLEREARVLASLNHPNIAAIHGLEQSNGRTFLVMEMVPGQIAYSSDGTGRFEIYLQPFPGPGRNVRVSSGGGTRPQWRRDGREIFYISPGNHLMAAPVTWLPSGSTVEVGTSVTLFPARTNQYEVSPDGQRFLINLPIGEAPTFPITIVLNWAARLKK